MIIYIYIYTHTHVHGGAKCAQAYNSAGAGMAAPPCSPGSWQKHCLRYVENIIYIYIYTHMYTRN